jgi:hypothetical protein
MSAPTTGNDCDIPSDEQDISTLASRNPTRVSIPIHSRPTQKLTDAEKISAHARHELNKENATALKNEIVTFFGVRDAELTRLAKKYNKTEAHMKQLLSNESTYQNMRAPSLQNALVHAKGLEVNQGKQA